MEETKVENSCSKDSCSIDTEMKEQVEVELYNDENQQYDDIDITDKSQWSNIILDNTVNNQMRLEVLQKYFEERENDTIEIINKITGFYQFSASKIIEQAGSIISSRKTMCTGHKIRGKLAERTGISDNPAIGT